MVMMRRSGPKKKTTNGSTRAKPVAAGRPMMKKVSTPKTRIKYGIEQGGRYATKGEAAPSLHRVGTGSVVIKRKKKKEPKTVSLKTLQRRGRKAPTRTKYKTRGGKGRIKCSKKAKSAAYGRCR